MAPAILDPHSERVEAELGIAHEREQLVEAGQALGRQRGELGSGAAAHDHRQVRGAIPEPCRGHGRDCSRGLDSRGAAGVYIAM